MDSEKIYDYIIIGSGPAGVQLGYFFKKENRDFLILERDTQPGAFYKKYPRHRKLISINKIHTGYEDKEVNLRFDWNSLLSDDDQLLFKHYSTDYFPKADTILTYLNDFVEKYALPIQFNQEIINITKADYFLLESKDGKYYRCRTLIVATGWVKPFIPEIPGIEHGVHYTEMRIEKEHYQNKKLLILGKGNSAFETAEGLIGATSTTHICSPHPITMAWNSHYVGNLRALNNNFLDTYHLKSQNAVLDATVHSIKKVGEQYKVRLTYNNNSGEQEELTYDRIILCTGFRFDNSIFCDDIKPKLTIGNRFPDQTTEYESVNVSDLYFAGTLTHMRDYKKQASAFIHGFRYNAECLSKILSNKYHNVPLPYTTVKNERDALCDQILSRINSSSSLWQQYGYLGDVAVVKNKKEIHYYDTFPVDYIHEKLLGKEKEYYVITLEFGKKSEDDGEHGSKSRVHRNDANNAHLSKFLHPIVRFFSNGKLIEEHHVIEDLEAVWKESIHIEPLKQFLKSSRAVSLELAP